ncbi:MAG: ferritin-like domain-containing protein, partial [Pseudaminobacter sp.]|nr:ferritin-like domain-containing protein [Pseudaminobacter sp.]
PLNASRRQDHASVRGQREGRHTMPSDPEPAGQSRKRGLPKHSTDIRDHEVAHRDFLKGALADKAIPDLEVDFSKVDFASRESVLTTAKTFEDLGVAAYNGAGKLLEKGDYLVAAGRIVSVEARHAATIRDLLQPGSVAFAGPDVVDKNGLDGALEPAKVLAAAGPFIKTEVTAKSL